MGPLSALHMHARLPSRTAMRAPGGRRHLAQWDWLHLFDLRCRAARHRAGRLFCFSASMLCEERPYQHRKNMIGCFARPVHVDTLPSSPLAVAQNGRFIDNGGSDNYYPGAMWIGTTGPKGKVRRGRRAVVRQLRQGPCVHGQATGGREPQSTRSPPCYHPSPMPLHGASAHTALGRSR